jgi:hypothetical protein
MRFRATPKSECPNLPAIIPDGGYPVNLQRVAVAGGLAYERHSAQIHGVSVSDGWLTINRIYAH